MYYILYNCFLLRSGQKCMKFDINKTFSKIFLWAILVSSFQFPVSSPQCPVPERNEGKRRPLPKYIWFYVFRMRQFIYSKAEREWNQISFQKFKGKLFPIQNVRKCFPFWRLRNNLSRNAWNVSKYPTQKILFNRPNKAAWNI